MRVVLLGPPGAGKGTHAAALADAYGMSLLATGDVFRDNVRRQSALGRAARQFIERGELVPDEIVIAMVTDRIAQPDVAACGFLLDGFPRSLAQATALDTFLRRQAQGLDAALRLIVPHDEIVSRVVNRRCCPSDGSVYHLQFAPPRVAGRCDVCGGPLSTRSDDIAEVVLRRLQAYEANALAVDRFYRDRGLLHDVVSVGPLQAVARAARDTLDGIASQSSAAGSSIDLTDADARVLVD